MNRAQTSTAVGNDTSSIVLTPHPPKVGYVPDRFAEAYMAAGPGMLGPHSQPRIPDAITDKYSCMLWDRERITAKVSAGVTKYYT